MPQQVLDFGPSPTKGLTPPPPLLPMNGLLPVVDPLASPPLPPVAPSPGSWSPSAGLGSPPVLAAQAPDAMIAEGPVDPAAAQSWLLHTQSNLLGYGYPRAVTPVRSVSPAPGSQPAEWTEASGQLLGPNVPPPLRPGVRHVTWSDGSAIGTAAVPSTVLAEQQRLDVEQNQLNLKQQELNLKRQILQEVHPSNGGSVWAVSPAGEMSRLVNGSSVPRQASVDASGKPTAHVEAHDPASRVAEARKAYANGGQRLPGRSKTPDRRASPNEQLANGDAEKPAPPQRTRYDGGAAKAARAKLEAEVAQLAEERSQLEAERKEIEKMRLQLDADRRAFEISRNLSLGVPQAKTVIAPNGVPIMTTSPANDTIVMLNIGGEVLLEVQRSTLMVFEGSHLANLFAGQWERQLPRDFKGRIFFDCRADAFVPLLEFLRQCRLEQRLAAATAASSGRPVRWRVTLPKLEKEEQQDAFERSLKYFGLESFVQGDAAVGVEGDRSVVQKTRPKGPTEATAIDGGEPAAPVASDSALLKTPDRPRSGAGARRAPASPDVRSAASLRIAEVRAAASADQRKRAASNSPDSRAISPASGRVALKSTSSPATGKPSTNVITLRKPG
eukprot:gnl/TRDRNA2_/TRDRNA2_168204_c0_seq1.p1 gnl/TRDRNA2_/TRDRNA2_168204_c0~~gnl/TRDRNA2_/TRDRNA2_168204_c0_seq1.p1  ORF type:complete len:677 (+),score=130.89 gnl/TRDRNA2_/TRDRNA2_168204_c0_seq1:194-2032(+)